MSHDKTGVGNCVLPAILVTTDIFAKLLNVQEYPEVAVWLIN